MRGVARRRAVLPLWRGKPQLGPRDWHGSPPVTRFCATPAKRWLYLGRHQGQARFAADISAWEPDGLDTAALAMFADPSEQHYPGAAEGTRFGELRLAMTRLALARRGHGRHRARGVQLAPLASLCAACGAESAMAMAGWERHCPACGAKHFPRTDPVVIMLVARGNKLLLGRSPGWPEGMYSALAGFVEPGETPEAAVAREVLEETGITNHVGPLPWARSPGPFRIR